MTNAIVSSLLLVLLMSTCAVAQTPAAAPPVRDVEFCELDLHPKAYDGQFVRVRGNISFGFEDFTLSAYCTMSRATYFPSIWLKYGADEPEASVYCCGNHNSPPGKDLEINGHKVGLVRDSEYFKLRSRLESGRLAYPDGTICYRDAPECRFYTEVQATITGLFTAKPNGTEFGGGYGHFGCCHLLAIQQVSDVTATRTAVPAGGQFRCDRQEWDTSCPVPKEDECKVDDPAVFGRITAHWNDSTELAKGKVDSHRSPGDRTSKWYSDDLLTAYWIETGGDTTHAPAKMVATRQQCVPVSDERHPAPIFADVSCKDFSRSWEEDKEAVRKWEVASKEEEHKENPTWNVPWGIVAQASQKVFAVDQPTANALPDSLASL